MLKGGAFLVTDKELKKLSRLELLELLLQASKENKKLKEQIKKLKLESQTTQNIENLSVITEQVENALRYANSITDTLKTTSGEDPIPKADIRNSTPKDSVTPVTEDRLKDKEIYIRILNFFANNDDKLNTLPNDIANDVRARIKTILERRKSN